jgi:hypothetical protein
MHLRKVVRLSRRYEVGPSQVFPLLSERPIEDCGRGVGHPQIPAMPRLPCHFCQDVPLRFLPMEQQLVHLVFTERVHHGANGGVIFCNPSVTVPCGRDTLQAQRNFSLKFEVALTDDGNLSTRWSAKGKNSGSDTTLERSGRSAGWGSPGTRAINGVQRLPFRCRSMVWPGRGLSWHQ